MVTITGSPRSQRRLYYLGGAVAAVVMSVALGAGIWQDGNDGTYSSERGAAAPLTLPAPMPAASTRTAPAPAPTVYVVATDEAAMALRVRMEAFGENDRPYEVLVVAPDGDEGRSLGPLYELNVVRAMNGVPTLEIVDLRWT
jgi:hypothetical protein